MSDARAVPRFADVAGHADAIARLRAVATHDRAAHAYLITGEPGVGKSTVAAAFAASLLCASPDDGGACGRCAQCTRIAAGTHPDLRRVVREEDRRDVRTEQARDVTRWLVLRPLMAARKVAVVEDADCLNEHGQNALLKTLEEPPGRAVIVLVATRTSQLLPTVRSRCQHVRLDPVDADAVAAFLVAHGTPPEAVPGLVARAGGSPGRALALRDDPDAALRAALLERLAELPSLAAADCSALAQRLAKAEAAVTLETMTAWYRDVLAVTLAGDDAPALRHPDQAGAVRAVAARAGAETVLRQLEAVCDTALAVERNANRVLAVETLLLILRRLERGEPVPDAWTSTAA